MDHTNLRIVVAVFAVAASVGTASAQSEDGDRRSPPSFEALDVDADGDGVLSRDALESRGGRRMGERLLARADNDRSGGVNAEEFAAAMEKIAERRSGRGGKGDRRTR